jgi:hypothetical protein
MARNVSQLPLEALGDVNMTSLATAIALTGRPAHATIVRLTATTQSVRITYGGTTPTAAIGDRIVAGGETIEISMTDLSLIQVIEEAASASLYVAYFRPQPVG